jgi:hypothetical protein
MRDLSTEHRPLLEAFEQRDSKILLDEYRLTAEQLEGVPPVAAGARMEGQFFPLLFDPEVFSDNKE